MDKIQTGGRTYRITGEWVEEKKEEAQAEYMAGEMNLEIKKYLHSFGASELAQRIVESTTEKQLDLIDDIIYDNLLNRYGKRKHQ